MNILFVSQLPFNPLLGGIERVTDILARALVERGHQVFYLCASVNGITKNLLNYEYPAKLFMLPNDGSFENPENINYYKSLLEELSVNVVINQQGINASQNSILLCGNKVISVVHSNPDCYVQSNLARILATPRTFIDCVKYGIKFLIFPFLRKRLIRIVKKSISEQYSYISIHSDAVVLLSDRYKKVFSSYLNKCNPRKLIGIPNPNLYTLQCIDSIVKEKLILYVGRLSNSDKSPIRLLKIWKSLYLKYPEWNLLFVGDGPDRYSMQHSIEKHNLERVQLLGQKCNLEEYYRKASMVCLTSTFEGWGMALTEGMQFGCIPFTFDNYGAAFDIIDDGINGYLIPAYNLNIYAKRLSELMSNDKKRKSMTRAAYHKSKNFEAKNIVAKWESLFNLI